jgi:hypothetical protein
MTLRSHGPEPCASANSATSATHRRMVLKDSKDTRAPSKSQNIHTSAIHFKSSFSKKFTPMDEADAWSFRRSCLRLAYCVVGCIVGCIVGFCVILWDGAIRDCRCIQHQWPPDGGRVVKKRGSGGVLRHRAYLSLKEGQRTNDKESERNRAGASRGAAYAALP